MTDKDREKLEEWQADVDALEYYPKQMELHLMSVSSCETIEDYFFNIKEILKECEGLTKELKIILREDKGVNKND